MCQLRNLTISYSKPSHFLHEIVYLFLHYTLSFSWSSVCYLTLLFFPLSFTKSFIYFVAFFWKVNFLFYWFLLLFFFLLVSTPSFIISNLVFILCLNWSLSPFSVWGKYYTADFRVFSVSIQNYKLSFLPDWIAIKMLMLSVAIWFSSGYFPTVHGFSFSSGVCLLYRY